MSELEPVDTTDDWDVAQLDLDAGEVDALVFADRDCRAMRRLQRELAAVQAQWEDEHGELLAKYNNHRDEITARIGRYETRLKELHRALLDRDRTRKTVKLLNGTLKASTPTKPGIEWVDTSAFIEWAEDNWESLLRYRVVPDVNECKRLLTAVDDKFVTTAGEVVPGIVPVPPATQFSVTVA